MEVLDDTNDAFPGLQTLADLMSKHTDDLKPNRRTLSQCDQELSALRSVQRQLERRVAWVRQERNTYTLVNTLPLELLATIFNIIVDSEPFNFWYILETLMLVCHHWNQLVNNTPSLWARIQKNSETPNAIITRALERSKDHSLEIDYDGTGWMEQEDQDAFLSLIFPHVRRWRIATLRLMGETQGLGLEPMTTLSAPLLESLSLGAFNRSDWAPDEPLNIFEGRPPARLQELSLIRIPVPWNPATLCNLKVLEIVSIQHFGPSLDQLFAILPASPMLESLSILSVTFSGGTSATLPNPIPMPALEKLSLHGISPPITNRILAGIHAPKCRFGSLRPEVRVDPFETLFTTDISHFFDRIRSSADTSSFFCDADRVSISWEGAWRIYFDVENIRIARRVLDWLSLSRESDSPAVPLLLVITESDPYLVKDILGVMADAEAVHRVKLVRNTPIAGALRMLATDGTGERSVREPFPALKEMCIGEVPDDDEWEDLLRVLRRRQGDIEARDGDQHLNPIRSLELAEDWYMGDDEALIAEFRSTHWPNHLEEVRRLLGHDGKLLWYRWIVTEDGTLEDQPGYHD